MSFVHLTPDHISRIVAEAEAAVPNECCGLLVGTGDVESGLVVTDVVISPNIAAPNRPDRFEVDPEVRFRTMRRLEGTPYDIVGHYHSHPEHPAEPSATDLENAFEPDLAWLIAGVKAGQVTTLRAFRVEPDASAFRPLMARPGIGNRFDLATK